MLHLTFSVIEIFVLNAFVSELMTVREFAW